MPGAQRLARSALLEAFCESPRFADTYYRAANPGGQNTGQRQARLEKRIYAAGQGCQGLFDGTGRRFSIADHHLVSVRYPGDEKISSGDRTRDPSPLLLRPMDEGLCRRQRPCGGGRGAPGSGNVARRQAGRRRSGKRSARAEAARNEPPEVGLFGERAGRPRRSRGSDSTNAATATARKLDKFESERARGAQESGAEREARRGATARVAVARTRLPGSRPPSAASLAREREKRPLVEFRAAALSPAPVRRRNGRRTGTAGGRERRRRHLRPARPRQSLDFEVSPAGKGVRRPSFPPRRPSASFVRRRFPARRSGGSAP